MKENTEILKELCVAEDEKPSVGVFEMLRSFYLPIPQRTKCRSPSRYLN